MLIDKRPTISAPDDDPYLWLEEIEGARALAFADAQNAAMRRPDGKNLLCLAWRGIFVEQGCTTGADALRLFETYSQSFYRAANVKFDMCEFDDDREVVIGSSDVILMPDQVTNRYTSAVRYYKVRYKTDADPDGRMWPLGPIPDRDQALAIFNNVDARKQNLGRFTFEETNPFIPDYHLVEKEWLNGPEVMYPLYKAT